MKTNRAVDQLAVGRDQLAVGKGARTSLPTHWLRGRGERTNWLGRTGQLVQDRGEVNWSKVREVDQLVIWGGDNWFGGR